MNNALLFLVIMTVLMTLVWFAKVIATAPHTEFLERQKSLPTPEDDR